MERIDTCGYVRRWHLEQILANGYISFGAQRVNIYSQSVIIIMTMGF